MAEEEVVKTETELDIYCDLPNFQYEEKLQKLELQNNSLERKILALEEALKKALSEKEEYESKCNTLSFNISALLKTAQAEIKRKDKMLDELRTRNDHPDFRRKRRDLSPKYYNEKRYSHHSHNYYRYRSTESPPRTKHSQEARKETRVEESALRDSRPNSQKEVLVEGSGLLESRPNSQKETCVKESELQDSVGPNSQKETRVESALRDSRSNSQKETRDEKSALQDSRVPNSHIETRDEESALRDSRPNCLKEPSDEESALRDSRVPNMDGEFCKSTSQNEILSSGKNKNLSCDKIPVGSNPISSIPQPHGLMTEYSRRMYKKLYGESSSSQTDEMKEQIVTENKNNLLEKHKLTLPGHEKTIKEIDCDKTNDDLKGEKDVDPNVSNKKYRQRDKENVQVRAKDRLNAYERQEQSPGDIHPKELVGTHSNESKLTNGHNNNSSQISLRKNYSKRPGSSVEEKVGESQWKQKLNFRDSPEFGRREFQSYINETDKHYCSDRGKKYDRSFNESSQFLYKNGLNMVSNSHCEKQVISHDRFNDKNLKKETNKTDLVSYSREKDNQLKPITQSNVRQSWLLHEISFPDQTSVFRKEENNAKALIIQKYEARLNKSSTVQIIVDSDKNEAVEVTDETSITVQKQREFSEENHKSNGNQIKKLTLDSNKHEISTSKLEKGKTPLETILDNSNKHNSQTKVSGPSHMELLPPNIEATGSSDQQTTESAGSLPQLPRSTDESGPVQIMSKGTTQNRMFCNSKKGEQSLKNFEKNKKAVLKFNELSTNCTQVDSKNGQSSKGKVTCKSMNHLPTETGALEENEILDANVLVQNEEGKPEFLLKLLRKKKQSMVSFNPISNNWNKKDNFQNDEKENDVEVNRKRLSPLIDSVEIHIPSDESKDKDSDKDSLNRVEKKLEDIFGSSVKWSDSQEHCTIECHGTIVAKTLCGSCEEENATKTDVITSKKCTKSINNSNRVNSGGQNVVETIFGSPLKWADSSESNRIDVSSPTLYEDSCSAQLENPKFKEPTESNCDSNSDKIINISKTKEKEFVTNESEIIKEKTVCNTFMPFSKKSDSESAVHMPASSSKSSEYTNNENQTQNIQGLLNNTKISSVSGSYSIFLSKETETQKTTVQLSETICSREAENSCKMIENVPRNGKYEDSVLGQFEDTTQLIYALTKMHKTISPINTPSKDDKDMEASNTLEKYKLNFSEENSLPDLGKHSLISKCFSETLEEKESPEIEQEYAPNNINTPVQSSLEEYNSFKRAATVNSFQTFTDKLHPSDLATKRINFSSLEKSVEISAQSSTGLMVPDRPCINSRSSTSPLPKSGFPLNTKISTENSSCNFITATTNIEKSQKSIIDQEFGAPIKLIKENNFNEAKQSETICSAAKQNHRQIQKEPIMSHHLQRRNFLSAFINSRPKLKALSSDKPVNILQPRKTPRIVSSKVNLLSLNSSNASKVNSSPLKLKPVSLPIEDVSGTDSLNNAFPSTMTHQETELVKANHKLPTDDNFKDDNVSDPTKFTVSSPVPSVSKEICGTHSLNNSLPKTMTHRETELVKANQKLPTDNVKDDNVCDKTMFTFSSKQENQMDTGKSTEVAGQQNKKEVPNEENYSVSVLNKSGDPKCVKTGKAEGCSLEKDKMIQAKNKSPSLSFENVDNNGCIKSNKRISSLAEEENISQSEKYSLGASANRQKKYHSDLRKDNTDKQKRWSSSTNSISPREKVMSSKFQKHSTPQNKAGVIDYEGRNNKLPNSLRKYSDSVSCIKRATDRNIAHKMKDRKFERRHSPDYEYKRRHDDRQFESIEHQRKYSCNKRKYCIEDALSLNKKLCLDKSPSLVKGNRNEIKLSNSGSEKAAKLIIRKSSFVRWTATTKVVDDVSHCVSMSKHSGKNENPFQRNVKENCKNENTPKNYKLQNCTSNRTSFGKTDVITSTPNRPDNRMPFKSPEKTIIRSRDPSCFSASSSDTLSASFKKFDSA